MILRGACTHIHPLIHTHTHKNQANTSTLILVPISTYLMRIPIIRHVYYMILVYKLRATIEKKPPSKSICLYTESDLDVFSGKCIARFLHQIFSTFTIISHTFRSVQFINQVRFSFSFDEYKNTGEWCVCVCL